MNREIDLSIIVPIYNTRPYLAQCLDSLRRQKGIRFECIMVDDGSTDGSGALAESYAARDPKRFIFLSQAHRGQGAARNLAMRHARGTYLGFVDSDDWIQEGMFSEMLAAAVEKDADIVYCDFFKAMRNGRFERVAFPAAPPEGIRPDAHATALFDYGNGVTNKLMKKALFDAEAIRFPEEMIFEDLAIVPLLISKSRRVVGFAKPFYFYRIRPDSTTHTGDETVYDLFKSCDRLQSDIDARYGDEVGYIILRELFFYALPRYVTLLRRDAFADFHAQTVRYARSIGLQRRNNPYLRRLSPFSRLYLALAMRTYRWPVLAVARLKWMKASFKSSRMPTP